MNFVFYRIHDGAGAWGNCGWREPIRSIQDVLAIQNAIEDTFHHPRGSVVVADWRPFDGEDTASPASPALDTAAIAPHLALCPPPR